MRRLKKILPKIDITKKVCEHLVGEEHSKTHRFTVGVVIMSMGVGITKAVFIFDPAFIHFIGDVLGYGFHGIGAIPFVEYLISKHTATDEETDSDEDGQPDA